MQQYQGIVTNDAGNAVSGVSVSVYIKGTTVKIGLFSDDGVTSLANPVTSGTGGLISFWAGNGQYDLVTTAVTGLTSTTKTITLDDPDQPMTGNAGLKNNGVALIAKSAVGVTAPADTNEDILAIITLPPLDSDDIVSVYALWTVTNNANAKTLRVRLGGIGGTAHSSVSAASVATVNSSSDIQNRGVTNSQVSFAGVGHGTSASAVITGAIQTNVSTTIVITAQKATAGDTITLEAYIVTITSGGV